MMTNQISPAVTCNPCVPTTVKKADKNALCDGPAPAATMLANSRPSIVRKHTPSRNVAPIQKRSARVSVRASARDPKPQVTLEAKRQIVSRNTCRLSNSSTPVGPPAVEFDSTAYVANRAAKRMMSDNKNSQKPNPATTRTGAGPRSDSGIVSMPERVASEALMRDASRVLPREQSLPPDVCVQPQQPLLLAL